MRSSEYTLRTDSGMQLYARLWEAEADTAGVVVIVHGLGEHSGRYAGVASQLTRAGYRVLAFDQRGHGRTAGPRGHVHSYDVLLDDINAFVAEAVCRAHGAPVFLYGHSLGGNLVLNYALRRQPDLAGLVVTSPLLRLTRTVPRWKTLGVRILGRVWPRLSLPDGVDPQLLSRDPAAVRTCLEDPLAHRRVSCRLATQMLDAGDWAVQHASRLKLPLLLMHGDADAVTSHAASVEFARGVSSACQLRIWDGLYHELHWELERDSVIRYIVDWLQNASLGTGNDRS